MKLKKILSLFGFIFFGITLYAQDKRNITISFTDKPLSEAIARIEKVSNYTFFYDASKIDLGQRVNLKAKNISISQAVTLMLSTSNVRFEIFNLQIVLYQKNPINTVIQACHKITGVVVDEGGQPIVGAIIKLEETNKVTNTDLDGKFSMNAPEEGKLKVSYVGYSSKVVLISRKTTVKIILSEEERLLDEIVVVGYGTQKKINLTGSIASVNSEVLATRPIANVSTGLQGTLPGVTIRNSTSRPGDNTVSIRIRGIGTLNNSDPLILIDGIEGNIGTLNPDDIESASVLKDAASSAIYGSRAANGVILITTKRAIREIKPTLNYTGYYALQEPTRKPQMLDAVDYLNLLKEATENVNKSWGYTTDDINEIINGTNPNYRANTNWVDGLYKESAPQRGHNLSLYGGSKTMGYYMSYGNLSTDGLLIGDGYHATRNNIRLKINTEIWDRLTVDGNIGYTDVDNWTPTDNDSEDGGVFYTALRCSPLVPVHFDDGQWGYGGSSANPVAIACDGGFNEYKSKETTLNVSGSLNIINGLTAKVQYGTQIYNVLSKHQTNIIEHFYPDTEVHLAYSSNTSSLSQSSILQSYQNLSTQIDYDKKIDKHAFHILGGFSQEWQIYERMYARREGLISNDLHVLDAGTEMQTNTGYADHWAIRSGFGRATYNFDERYLFETNIRYDLSSRFYKNNRGGYFPSASFAWRLSKESFMEKAQSWLNNFKIRASYGTLGNQNTSSLYPYLSTIGASASSMPIGTNYTSSMQQSVASNKKISWETIQMSNIGFDFSVLNNRLTFSGDYYLKNTNGILLKVNLPDVLGVSEPYQNAGKVQNKGWETDLSWRDKIGKDFNYGVRFNLSDVINKVISVGNTADDFSSDQIRAVGYPIDAFWGFVSDGLSTVDDFDYDSGTNVYTPKKTFAIMDEYRTKIQPGDIKYKDLNKDGKITTADDRTYIGNSIPRLAFSLAGNVEWKNIDFQFYFQGIGKCDGYIKGLGRHAFTHLANYPQTAHLDRWTWGNQNANAAYPRLTYEEDYNQKYISTFWIENASYLRLKNIQIGYTIPKEIAQRIKIEKCRIYFSGENLLTFSDFYYAYDPEVPVSSGGYYPVTKTLSLGLNVTLK